MIRTLHVVGSKIGGGAENFLVRLAGALHERGHPAHVALRPESPLEPALPEGVESTLVAMRNGLDVLSMWKISRLARATEADVVQTYMGRATRLTRLRRQSAVHVGRLGNYYPLRAYRHCDAWVGNTRGICDYMVRGGLPTERVHHIYNFVEVPPDPRDGELDALRRSLDIPDDAMVVMSPGRFVRVKGFDLLIDAFSRLPEQVLGRRTILVLVGDGPDAPALRDGARQLGIDDRIRWTGWVPTVAPHYALADLVVFPARREEPFGNVVLESWAHGAPLLVTRFLGAEEFVRHGEDARIVPCEDPPALAEAIEELLSNAEGRRILRAAGRARVESDFSVARIVGEYLQLYRSLTAGMGSN